jgi:hypothetical protein
VKLNDYNKAVLEVYFEHVPFGVLEDGDLTSADTEYQRFTSIGQLKPSAEYVMLPGGVLMYVKNGGGGPTGKRIPFNTGKILPVLEMEVVWHALPFEIYAPLAPGPWFKRVFGDGTNRPYWGTVNKNDLFGFKAGTILFSHVELRSRRHPIMGLSWDVVFTLAFDPNKWNFKFFWDTSGGSDSGFYFVGKDTTYYAPGSLPGDDLTIYNERDLALLWKVAA